MSIRINGNAVDVNDSAVTNVRRAGGNAVDYGGAAVSPSVSVGNQVASPEVNVSRGVQQSQPQVRSTSTTASQTSPSYVVNETTQPSEAKKAREKIKKETEEARRESTKPKSASKKSTLKSGVGVPSTEEVSDELNSTIKTPLSEIPAAGIEDTTPQKSVPVMDVSSVNTVEAAPEASPVMPAPAPAPKAKPPKRRGRPSGKTSKWGPSRIAATQNKIDREAADGTRTTRVTPTDLLASIGEYGQARRAQAAEEQAQFEQENAALQEILDNWGNNLPLGQAWNAARQDYAYEQAEQDARQRDAHPTPTTRGAWGSDEEYNFYFDLGDAKTEEERIEKMREYQTKRNEGLVFGLSETIEDPEAVLDQQNEVAERAPWDELQTKIQRNAARARDLTKRMFVCPLLIGTEGQMVKTKKEKERGKTITKGRAMYNETELRALGDIRELYNVSLSDAMDLIMLRASLGVDMQMKIGGVDASKFQLKTDQLVELAKDIRKSQEIYGHPMGLVDGTPGGVRDEQTGKFVIVAGTKCYPAGYIPMTLLTKMCQNQGSVLAGSDPVQIQTLVGNTWVNYTYKTLVRNAEKDENVFWQQRSIENMMKALVSLDGINTESKLDMLKIPERVIPKTLMQMEAERSQARDSDISRAIEERQRRFEKSHDDWWHRNRKSNGSRDPDTGQLLSPGDRRRNAVGDLARGVSSAEKACKCADFFLWITSPLEAFKAISEQNIGNYIRRQWFKANHGDAADYAMTDNLHQLAQSSDAIEARDVAERLYRIGGHVALDAFLGDERYELTMSDLRRFLFDSGVNGPTLAERLGVDPEHDGMLAKISRLALSEDMLLGGSHLFKSRESLDFVDMSLLEMGQASTRGLESYTARDIEQWGAGPNGGRALVTQLLMTGAGREAFMTQGITSLGRKSPYEHAIREIMTRNGLTELLFRNLVDRFPEYGMQKFMQNIPMSNTLCYLSSYGITSVGSLMSMIGEGDAIVSGGIAPMARAGNALQRASEYQIGRGNGSRFLDGLAKNMLYDCVMGGSKLIMAGIYAGILKALGGVQPPDNKEDYYTWSEWTIGGEDDEDRLPIRWAWFMDDLSGWGLPFGMAYVVAEQGNWSQESRETASHLFENAVAGFMDGTVLFDCIEMIRNFDEELGIANNENAAWLDASPTERRNTNVQMMAWKFMGDMTPTIVKQLLPWSRDYLFRGDYYKRTASKWYDTDGRTLEEAMSQYKTKDVDRYQDYMWLREAQNNPVAALVMNFATGRGIFGKDKQGFLFTEQVEATRVDDLALSTWQSFEVPDSELVGKDMDELREFWRAHAEEVCQHIRENYSSPMDALSKGFVIDPKTRSACMEYCQWMMYQKLPDERKDEVSREKDNLGVRYLPDDMYNGIDQKWQDQIDYYDNLYDFYFSGDSIIPWNLPRYKVLDSDYETRYVHSDGTPATYSEWATGNAKRESYSYGNIPNILPFYSPQRTGGRAQESLPYWYRDGMDTQGVYDIASGIDAEGGGTLADLLFDGKQDNSPTMGRRGLELMEDSLPEGFSSWYDPATASKVLGFDAFDKSKKDEDTSHTASSSSGSGGGWYSGRSWYPSGGRTYASGASYSSSYGSSSYNPKIYNNAKQVYSTRASSMSTRQPYKATTTYLRPGFSTKGSREAYKRSDI